MDMEDTDWNEDEVEEDEPRWTEPADLLLGVHSGGWREASLSSFSAKPSVSTSCERNDSIMSRMALNDNKAGMDGLDKEKINKIIMEASKGSRFYENERKKEAQVNQRIDRMMQQLAGITQQQKAAALVEMDAMIAELETSRDLSRSIVHLDMDAFYAAVEMRDNPSLKDKPMAVGGMSMLSTSNYHARRYGVRAAMPGFIGKKLCPELVIVPTNFDKYRAVSAQVREILAQYDPNFCPMSLDEAYFDLTGHLERRKGFSEAQRTFDYRDRNQEEDGWNGGGSDGRRCANLSGTQYPHQEGDIEDVRRDGAVSNRTGDEDILPSSRHHQDFSSDTSAPCLCVESTDSSDNCCTRSRGETERTISNAVKVATSGKGRQCRTFGFTIEEAVEEIRFRIEQKTQLTASAGIAPNVMLAKICSDKNKPNGQYRIQPDREAVMEFIQVLPIRKVSGIGKVTEKMLSALGVQTCTDLYQQRALLHLLFSQISSQHFLRISLGIGSTKVERDSERKSMSTERTFGELHRPADLYSKCHELCQALAEDLQSEELTGKTVTIKLKTVKFEVKTKACSVPTCISSAESIFSVAKDLLRAEISACKPEPLRLRLMGVRLSNLQPCGAATNKQGNITEFFRKQRQTPALQSQQLPKMQPGISNGEERPKSQNTATVNISSNSPHKRVGTDLANAVLEPELSTSKAHMDVSVSQSHPRDLESWQLSEERTRDDLTIAENHKHTAETGEVPKGLLVASSDLLCPVCNVPQPCTDLEAFNEHVDLCLNRRAIRDMLKQQASEEMPTTSRSSTSPAKGKRSLSGPKSAAKRRKQEVTQTNTLDKFFS
ncbi:DNA polymerase kappa-like [Acanthaster planci]|uniref:DNA polymerase kappa n=1 Tax=Acanthaster planci TaxID=133434 RepID=A0A8B7YQ85_ACAPL|nr:DNA polymerase kappa-like [Acanthaster planci]XP_022095448.1 DNA polymerase kappa-like [Acanthaster planci]XP_022095456.1 DNA polymerase kappa-like [Acanthaster planci]XP_022095465.1 DNA polymerase kappa-like [Acanthaster planci]